MQHIQQISPELNLFHYNEIPVLELKHSLGEAKISLQGAQLLSWKPQDYKNMLCLETARLSQLLNKGDMVSVVLKVAK